MIGSATHTEIMDTSGYVEDLPHIIVGPESAFVPNHVHYLSSSDGMLNPDPLSGNLPVLPPLLGGEILSLGLLRRLDHPGVVRRVALVSGILHEHAAVREAVVCVRDPLVMDGAAYRGAYEKHQSADSADDSVLDSVPLFLAAVVIRLCFRVVRARHLALGCVMDEKVGGLVPAHPIELGPELSHGLCRKYVHLLERLLEDVREPVDEKAALLLVHFEPVGKGFLEGIGLHEVEDEEQPVGNRGERMLLVDRMLAGTNNALPTHVVESHVLVICVFKVGKHLSEHFGCHACDGFEILNFFEFVCVFHNLGVLCCNNVNTPILARARKY